MYSKVKQLKNITHSDKVIIIPSRIGSARLPNKPLALIHGKTLIQHCYEAALRTGIENVYVATDSEKIAEIIEKINGKVVMTPSDLPSGTDRIMYAYNKIGKNFKCIVNLQGDLPNISEKVINKTIEAFECTPCDIATCVVKMNHEDAQKPSCVKAVLSQKGDFHQALYFSREKVPYNAEFFYEHIGIYIYSEDSLKKFTSFGESYLEKTEKLEQLRALENNMSIYASVVDSSLKPISVDTADDLTAAIKIMQKTGFVSTKKYTELAQSLKNNLLRRKQ